jgi:hypothetical protein
VVEHAQLHARGGGQVDAVEAAARLQMPQQREAAVEHAAVGVRGDERDATPAQRHRANQIALVTKRRDRQAKRRDTGIGCPGQHDRRRRAARRDAATQLGRRDPQRRRISTDIDAGGTRLGRAGGAVAHPQVVAVFGARLGASKGHREHRDSQTDRPYHHHLLRRVRIDTAALCPTWYRYHDDGIDSNAALARRYGCRAIHIIAARRLGATCSAGWEPRRSQR